MKMHLSESHPDRPGALHKATESRQDKLSSMVFLQYLVQMTVSEAIRIHRSQSDSIAVYLKDVFATSTALLSVAVNKLMNKSS